MISCCRVCDATDLVPAIDLGMQPWCNNFLKADEVGHESFYPLRVVICASCRTAQLDYTVPKEVMFADHTYLSGITRTLAEHFSAVAADVDSRFEFRRDKSVLDIGSNDGTQLRFYKELGYEVLGVDPSLTAVRIAKDAGIPTLRAFFNLDTARSIGRSFDVVNAAGVFFHLEELHSVTEGIRELLAKDGVFVVQFLYMRSIIENVAFDQIYHEHLLYYNVATIDVLLNRHGLSLFDAYVSPIHGGSVIAFAGHPGVRPRSARLEQLFAAEARGDMNEVATYRQFARRIESVKERDLSLLRGARDSGKQVFGYGAPAKGNTLLNFFDIGTDLVKCLVEKNELRRGLYSPGMHIPIVLERELPAPPDVYYVLAWNFRDEILANNRELLRKGVEFLFPVTPMAAVAR